MSKISFPLHCNNCTDENIIYFLVFQTMTVYIAYKIANFFALKRCMGNTNRVDNTGKMIL